MMQAYYRSQVKYGARRRGAEDKACLGGLRSPRRAVRRLPQLSTVRALVCQALQGVAQLHPAIVSSFLHHPSLEKSPRVFHSIETECLSALQSAVGPFNVVRGAESTWRPGLLRAFSWTAGGLDTDIISWVQDGAPKEWARGSTAVEPSMVFPRVARPISKVCLEDLYAHTEPSGSYISVSEHSGAVLAELQRLEAAGYVEWFASLDEVRRKLGAAIMSNLACVRSVRADGTRKHRLVVDLRQSGVNSVAPLGERLVLPRIWDAVQPGIYRCRQAAADESVSMVAVDFKGAHHTTGVGPAEIRHRAAQGPEGRLYAYRALTLGGGASPLVWGRAGARLGRSTSSPFGADKARLQLYVDDPLMLSRGTPSTIRMHMCVALLWWQCVGLPISWNKLQVGPSVSWIGMHVPILSSNSIFHLTESVARKLADACEEVLVTRSIPAKDVELAGRAPWGGLHRPRIPTCDPL